MLFSEVLDTLTQIDGVWTVKVPDEWKQGRSVFGGLQVALGLRALRTLVPREIPLRVLQTTFVAPPTSDTSTIQVQVLRAGKNAIHAEARTVEGEQTLSVVVAVFGSRRDSRVKVVPHQSAVHPQASVDFRYIPGVTPSFTQFFSMRWLLGDVPFTGNPLTRAVIEVGLQDSATTNEDHVVAIADAIPPVALSMLDKPVPGASMTWTLELLRDRVDDLPLTGWRLDADLTAGADGYTSQSVMVWGPGGEAVALSRQCMVIFG